MLRSALAGTAAALGFTRFVASAGHQRVWPPVEKTMTTQKNYPVVLYDEV